MQKKSQRRDRRKSRQIHSQKQWFEVQAPDIFLNRDVGKMPVTKSAGARDCRDDLKGRIVEISLADLQRDEEQAHRKIRLRVEDVQGKYCLTNFYGMDFTRDRLRALVRKWQTLIEAFVDVRTTDNYLLRMFCIGFTKRRTNQMKKTSYAQSSQVHQIRTKMREIMTREASTVTLRQLVLKFIPGAIGRLIEKECNGIYPLMHVYVRKVKVISTPKLDSQALKDLHGDVTAQMDEDEGQPVDAGGEWKLPEEEEAGEDEGEAKEEPADEPQGD